LDLVGTILSRAEWESILAYCTANPKAQPKTFSFDLTQFQQVFSALAYYFEPNPYVSLHTKVRLLASHSSSSSHSRSAFLALLFLFGLI
jgi:hypothetical protein